MYKRQDASPWTVDSNLRLVDVRSHFVASAVMLGTLIVSMMIFFSSSVAELR